MVNKLKRVMDYQRFSPNSRLGEMISNAEQRYTKLADTDLFFVTAAGESYRSDDDIVTVPEHVMDNLGWLPK